MTRFEEDWQIPEGGVCGAFNSASQRAKFVRKAEMSQLPAGEGPVDWDAVPDDDPKPAKQAGEVVEDINDPAYVPTRVLRETQERIEQRHHGDEPTEEQAAELALIDEELDSRAASRRLGTEKTADLAFDPDALVQYLASRGIQAQLDFLTDQEASYSYSGGGIEQVQDALAEYAGTDPEFPEDWDVWEDGFQVTSEE